MSMSVADREAMASRFSSLTSTSTSTNSTRSSGTLKPSSTGEKPSSGPGRRLDGGSHMRIETSEGFSSRPTRHDDDEMDDDDGQVSPTSTTSTTAATRGRLSPVSMGSAASVSAPSIEAGKGCVFGPPSERRKSDLGRYRRDMVALEKTRFHVFAGGAVPNPHVAPWMSPSSLSPPLPKGATTSFFNDNDSSDSLSGVSQLSPSLLSGGGGVSTAATPATTGLGFAAARQQEAAEGEYFDSEARRPSAASIATTVSSQASRTSAARGGLRKLQGFFGEEFPGRDSSESSLPTSVATKEQRTRPSQRDRNYSNATDRDGSPSSSRPRTPVPAPEVVPFLYQDNTDIARYGEAPVRDILTGPDRERYVTDGSAAQPPKTSSSARSGHSIVHLGGHHHRHNRSNDDPRSLRRAASKEDSLAGLRERGATMHNQQRSRAHSPTPSSHGLGARGGHGDGQTSPVHHSKRGLLGRLRRHKDKERDRERDKEREREREDGGVARLRELPPSTRSLQTKASRAELSPSPFAGGNWPSQGDVSYESAEARQRAATFNNKFMFAKKTRANRSIEYLNDEGIGPTDRQEAGHVYALDTNLNDMEGILTKPPPLAPMDTSFVAEADVPESSTEEHQGGWDAPDSWAVRRVPEERLSNTLEADEAGSRPRPEEKLSPYFIRIFRSDGTFSTHSMSLDATVSEVITQVVKKTYVVEGLENYHIIMKKHDLIRVLTRAERPLLMQKRLLQQVGYEEKDRIEELGREDNGYLCRFMFLSARESDFHAKTADLGISRSQKFNYVDLSGRNLVAIPISLYSKASDIISLNLSRNLSLDVPRDFIQSCKHLRDIKYNNNEARKLPLSLGRASRLTYLDVSNNRLEQLEHAELDKLVGLLKMNLANNRLSQIPASFGAFESLRSLNMSSNFLDSFPGFLCGLQSLVDLDLSFNTIGRLPEEIGQLKNLEKLLITNNRLADEVPAGFGQLVSLRELDIKYNLITSIDIFSELPKLEILYAAHNNVSAFVGKFERLRQLKLNSNPLNKFEIVEPVPTLKTLNLSHAQLASIDLAFVNMRNLERLVLDKNYFVSLPQHIGVLRRLEHFSIANNSVGELPGQIGCLTELRVLDVRGNNISKLPMEMWWANKLETLNASSNVLDAFPKAASRAPRVPGEGPGSAGGAEEGGEERRPSQASSTLLSVGPLALGGGGAERKGSVVSVYGKGGRKTSIVSRGASQGTSMGRKDSGLSWRLSNTFAGSLRNLYLADNRLDDDVFEQLTQLAELRVLNLSYNDEIGDMPQRCIKSWPQLVELYLSGNGLTTVPADDLEETSLLQTLYLNGNRFTNLPADIWRARKLAVLDCGSNVLKYNIANVPYDWNWNLNPNLRYLNLSGNKRLEIKATGQQYSDFGRLGNLRVLGLMDVTLTQPSIPDQSEDRRVRTSGSLAGHLPYGMADTLGRHEHLSTVDLVVPRFNSSETEMLLGLFDGQALSSGGSKIAKYLHENFGHVFAQELKGLRRRGGETAADALRRAFLGLNKELVTMAQHGEERRAPVVLSREDLNSGGVATVVYLQGTELWVANVGDAQAMVMQTDGSHHMLTRKHDPAEPAERARIREAGGWVSRNGRLNDLLHVSRAFGYVDLMPAVQAAPHVSNMAVRDSDDIVLLATSELWDYLSPGLVTDIARAERQDLMRAAQKLRDLAMAYGASGKLMVMMISVADLRRRVERSRLHRGTSMSLYASGLPDEAQVLSTRRGRRARADVLDSSLNRLEAEIAAPTGNVSIVFTDIKNSTTLWEMYPSAMRSAIKLHNEVMRRQLRRIGGYEVKTEGDAFMVSFPTATSALLWCFAVQLSLLDVAWPSEILNSLSGHPLVDKANNVIFRGLSVRMGIHFGDCVSETDPVTRRMDYFGPMVNKASRISAVADGGQITVSSDFISEIQRCLENHSDPDAPPDPASDDAPEYESYASAIRKDLRYLTSQGFEVKEMGEKKLKGLENPEVVYSLYPHQLAARIPHHLHPDEPAAPDAAPPALLRELPFDPESIWALWRVSLRLEMLCSALEHHLPTELHAPETQLLERIKARGAANVSERFLVSFAEHQVSRIETCISTLAMRHLAQGKSSFDSINELRGPMHQVLKHFARQQKLVDKYRARFGDVSDVSDTSSDQDGPDGPDQDQDQDLDSNQDLDQDSDSNQDSAQDSDSDQAWQSDQTEMQHPETQQTTTA